MSTTSLADIHPNIIQKHILPRLDGPSLSAVAAVSTSLQAICSDDNLWAQITKSTWPSITHPRVDDVISTFPAGHRSFFQDSFPSLITDVNHRHSSKPDSLSDHTCNSPSDQLISAVDIRYKNDIIYSKVQFTNITTDFLCSPLRIELNEKPRISRHIDLEVDELAGADTATLSCLKESLTLNWILIDPTRKRAGNLSSIKAVRSRQDWMSSETVVQYVTVLPGCDPNEMVKCKIQVVLEVGGVSLHVKEVILKCEDLDSNYVNGGEFLVISQAAIMEENNVRRTVVGDEKRWKNRKELGVKKEEEKRDIAIKINYVRILVSFCFSLYFLTFLLS